MPYSTIQGHTQLNCQKPIAYMCIWHGVYVKRENGMTPPVPKYLYWRDELIDARHAKNGHQKIPHAPVKEAAVTLTPANVLANEWDITTLTNQFRKDRSSYPQSSHDEIVENSAV